MPATILVADDDPDLLQLVATLLERGGHQVVRAADGQEAMRAVYERLALRARPAPGARVVRATVCVCQPRKFARTATFTSA